MILAPSRKIIAPDYCPTCGKVRHPRRAPTFPARRNRWLPNRWRGGVDAMNAGNGIQVDSSGRIKVKSNGIVVAGASDACCCVCCPAGSVNILTMTSITVVVSGVTLCSCYKFSSSIYLIPDNPNGTWTIPMSGGTGGIYFGNRYVYSDSGCSHLTGTIPLAMQFIYTVGALSSYLTFSIDDLFGSNVAKCARTNEFCNKSSAASSLTPPCNNGLQLGYGGSAYFS
jgi:hypothetical protein